ncbi:MAG: DUF4397 domain-containing protein [Gemmatimonadota bacterium]
MKDMTTRVTALAGLAIVAVLAGCDNKKNDTAADLPASDSSVHQGSSMVRLVNAVPSTEAVDLYADDADAFTGVAFKSVTPFKGIRDNMVTFRLRPTGSSVSDTTEPIAENREMMSDGDRYTVVVLPGDPADSGSHPKLRVLEEPTDAGDATKARIRFVNAARGLKSFDVFVPGNSDAFFDDVDFGTEAGYKDMAATSGVIQVRADNAPTVLLKVPERSFDAGKTYTIIITNKSATGRQLEAITIEDEVPAATTGATVPAGASVNPDSAKSY